MTEYEITIKVTDQELNAAQCGALSDMELLADRVIEAAEQKGYVPSH